MRRARAHRGGTHPPHRAGRRPAPIRGRVGDNHHQSFAGRAASSLTSTARRRGALPDPVRRLGFALSEAEVIYWGLRRLFLSQQYVVVNPPKYISSITCLVPGRIPWPRTMTHNRRRRGPGGRGGLPGVHGRGSPLRVTRTASGGRTGLTEILNKTPPDRPERRGLRLRGRVQLP